VFQWGWSYFVTYWNQYLVRADGGLVFPDLVPVAIRKADAPFYAAVAFAVLGGWMVMRGRIAGLAAGFVAVLLTFVSFGYNRVYATTNGTANTASFPYARMYLAIPVLFVYLLFLANHRPWPRLVRSPVSRWMTRGAMAGLLVAGLYAFSLKQKELVREIDREVHASGGVVCPQIPIEQFYAVAHELQRIAAENKADLVLVGGGDRWKHLAYALYPVTGIDAIYGPWERRAWRMLQEYGATHEAILFVNHSVPAGAKSAAPARMLYVDPMGSVAENLPVIPRSLRFKGTDPAKVPKVTSAERLSITSIGGARVYREGRDFAVETKPEGLELRRAAGSTIADGETVLLSWRDLTPVTVPDILVLKTGGKNAYQAGVGGLATVYKTPVTKANPTPGLRVIGNGR
jgi:hypothetical protein